MPLSRTTSVAAWQAEADACAREVQVFAGDLASWARELATEEDRLILDAIWVSNPVANPEDPSAGLPDGGAGE